MGTQYWQRFLFVEVTMLLRKITHNLNYLCMCTIIIDIKNYISGETI